MLFASCRDMPDDNAPPLKPPVAPDAAAEDDQVTRIEPAGGYLGPSSNSSAAAASAAPTPSPAIPQIEPDTHPPTHPLTTPLSRSLPGSPAPGSAGADTVIQTLPGGESAGPTMRQVGRYQIVERIGRGGMATVFRAHDPSIGRDVAIKFLHATLSADEEYRARVLQEARAAGGL
jgi:hypothetical protein